MFLTEPHPDYKKSYLEGLQEFHDEGRMLKFDLPSVNSDFERFLRHLSLQKDRSKLAPYQVPQSTFWLIDNNEFVGFLNLRHELNEALKRIGGHIGYAIRPTKRGHGYGKEQLRLGLQKAREQGLKRVLITCDENNIASQKVIEANGGILENTIEVEGALSKKLRYWINLETPTTVSHNPD